MVLHHHSLEDYWLHSLNSDLEPLCRTNSNSSRHPSTFSIHRIQGTFECAALSGGTFGLLVVAGQRGGWELMIEPKLAFPNSFTSQLFPTLTYSNYARYLTADRLYICRVHPRYCSGRSGGLGLDRR